MERPGPRGMIESAMRMRIIALLAALSVPVFAAEPSAVFDAHGCRSCHKIGERGGNSGPDLTTVGHRRSRAWLEKWLHSPRAFKPGTKMPEQGLAASDRAALAEFLSAQTGQAWKGAKPWDKSADKGKTIYSRAGCVACHGSAGIGGHPNPGAHGDIIPALAPLMSTYTKDELISRIKRGSVPETHGGPPAATDMPAWAGVLTDAEIATVADYLLTLATTDPKDDF